MNRRVRGVHDGHARRIADRPRLVGHPMSGIARAAAPVRLDFAGGWTDVPPFSARQHGDGRRRRDRALCPRRSPARKLPDVGLAARDLGESLDVPDASHLGPRGPARAPLRAGVRLLPVDACSAPVPIRTRRMDPGSAAPGPLDVALVSALSSARGEAPDSATRLPTWRAGSRPTRRGSREAGRISSRPHIGGFTTCSGFGTLLRR